MITTTHQFDWVLTQNPDAVFVHNFRLHKGTTKQALSSKQRKVSGDKFTPQYQLQGVDKTKQKAYKFNTKAIPELFMWPIRERVSDIERFFSTFFVRGLFAYGIGYGIAYVVGGTVLWPFTLGASVFIASGQETVDKYSDLIQYAQNPNIVPHSKTPILIEV